MGSGANTYDWTEPWIPKNNGFKPTPKEKCYSGRKIDSQRFNFGLW